MQFHFEPAFTRDRLGIEVVKQYDLVKIQPTEFVAKYLSCNDFIALEIKVKFYIFVDTSLTFSLNFI